MPEQPRLDVLGAQGLAQQRVVEQVDLRDGEVVRGVPVREQVVELRVADGRMRLARRPSAPGAAGRGRAVRLWDVGGCRSLARHGRPPFRLQRVAFKYAALRPRPKQTLVSSTLSRVSNARAAAPPSDAIPSLACVSVWEALTTRQLARIFFTIAAFCALLFLLVQIRSTLLLLAIAIFLAVALGPAVDRFSERMPRAAAILAIYVMIVLAFIGRARARRAARHQRRGRPVARHPDLHRRPAQQRQDPRVRQQVRRHGALAGRGTQAPRQARRRRRRAAVGRRRRVQRGLPAADDPHDDVLPAARRQAHGEVAAAALRRRAARSACTRSSAGSTARRRATSRAP